MILNQAVRTAVGVGIVLLLAGLAAGDEQQAARDIREMTGAHTRLVWCRAVDDQSDTVASGPGFRLYGFDTDDGRGVRLILPDESSYAKPMLTPDGTRVIYSNRRDRLIYQVDFDGSNHEKLAKGFASDIWVDPDTGIEWIYARGGDGNLKDPVIRFQTRSPDRTETVWKETETGHEGVPWFALSADGTRAVDAFPWRACGVADLTGSGRWERYGSGCWPSISPDNSYRTFIFNGSHETINLFDADGSNRRQIQLNVAPELVGRRVYHPRWSNHPRFMTMTGPRNHRGTQEDSEIYLARFNSDYTSVELAVRVTYNDNGDFYGDAWIERGETIPAAPVARDEFEEPDAALDDFSAWPAYTEGLVFLWENDDETNQIIRPDGTPGATSHVEARGLARYGRFAEMDLTGGAFLAEGVDDALLEACRESNELSIEATITPENLKQSGPARIVTFSSSTGSRNFTLGQQGDRLVLRLRTPNTGNNGVSPEVDLAELEAGEPHHVLVTYRPGHLVCYVNGERVLTTESIQGDFSNWSEQHLLFGEEWDGGRGWDGGLEGIAIFSRFIGEAEAQARYELFAPRLEDREPAARWEVEAKRVAVTPAPTPESIAPYRRALVVHTYEVEEVVSGELEADRIQVAHWAIMDGKALPVEFEEGATERLLIERFEDHPQLSGERQISDSDEFDLDLFHEVSR